MYVQMGDLVFRDKLRDDLREKKKRPSGGN